MKKILFSLACATLMVACSEDHLVTNEDEQGSSLPKTEVFVQGQFLESEGVNKSMQTRASYQWPYNTGEGWETARFSIRADGTIPDYTDKSSALYYGRFAGGNNRGKVATGYPYGHYNDRDLDYYKVDKKTGNNIGLFRYVYDPTGQKTQLAIVEPCDVVLILQDEIEDLTKEINNGKNVAKNTAELERVNNLLALGSEYLNKHVLWYVVKEVGMQYGWHVNGVFIDYEVPVAEPGQVDDNINVDIHQQEHKDWNEIKTSIHIRTDCESVTVNIPLKYETIVEQDDFDIRVYDFYYKEYSPVSHTIKHDENGITIEISNIPASLIEELKANYGDGLTVEIHSYCTKQDFWDELKRSCVVKTGKACTVTGQITSVYQPGEEEPIKIMQP